MASSYVCARLLFIKRRAHYLGDSQPLVANMSDTVTNADHAVSDQQNLIASFDALMKKLEVLVEVGVARVCFSVPSPLLHDLIDHFFKIKKRSILMSIWCGRCFRQE
jgi:hypothetical protein